MNKTRFFAFLLKKIAVYHILNGFFWILDIKFYLNLKNENLIFSLISKKGYRRFFSSNNRTNGHAIKEQPLVFPPSNIGQPAPGLCWKTVKIKKQNRNTKL